MDLLEIAKTLSWCLLAIPVMALGMWLSTKNWLFYSIVVAATAWIAIVISQPVHGIWMNPEITTTVKIMAWSLLPIFFVVLNIGAIFQIKAIRRRGLNE